MNEPETRQVISVGELNAYIKSKLEGDFLLRGVSLRGEISNFKTYASGHSYFTLKDKDSMIAAVIWASSGVRLIFRPKDGDEVLAYGRVSVYPPRGNYQFVVERMELFGVGAELLRLQQLKAKLAAEGLFAESRKRPLARFPKRVGVIAGKGSAGLRDVVVNLYKRFPLTELVVFPSLVQGKEAPAALLEALSKAAKADLDTLILARGGGSSEDLGAFNDEALVRALAVFPCPVIAAVGHEVDVTLVDLVADKRVSTPTAAAIAAVPDKEEIYQYLDESLLRLQNAMEGRLGRWRKDIESLSRRGFFLRPEALYEQRLADLALTHRRLGLALTRHFSYYGELLQKEAARLVALDPRRVLARGYAMVTDEKGTPLGSVHAMRVGQKVKTRLKDGIMEAEVTSLAEGEPR